MPDAPNPDVPRGDAPRKASHTVDLSSGSAPARPKRPKGFVPVVQQTINLTTKREAGPGRRDVQTGTSGPSQTQGPPSKAPDPSQPGGKRRRDDAPRGETAPRGKTAPRGDARQPSGGTSLADLLDEATLARLRGGT